VPAQRTTPAASAVPDGLASQVLAAIADPAIVLDLDGRVVWCNGAFARRIAAARGVDVTPGVHLHALATGGEREAGIIRDLLATCAAGGSSRTVHAFPPWHLETRASPLLAADGRPEAALFVLRDVSRRETAAAERDAALHEARAAAEAAERANRAKSAFLSRMSHELRTPLNAILGFGQILETEVLGESRAHVGHIVDAGQHLLGLIDEILDLARLEAGHISVTPTTMDAHEALQDVAVLLAPVAADAGVVITVPPSSGPVWVTADPQRLKQVVINLVGNAIKYGASGGICRLELGQREDGVVSLGVCDEGPGVPPELQERLFAPFDRLDAEGGTIPGSGLGLALSRGLVEAMGGRLEVDSGVGRGTSCRVRLRATSAPAHHEPAAASARSARLESAATAGLVLYIEDNASNVRLVESILGRRPGVQLAVATDGAIGVRLAQQARPDLVLLDMHLPGEDGESVLAELRSDHRTADLPVVVVSADASPDRIARLREAGVGDYLTKPIDVARFLEVLDRALGRPPRLRILVADDQPVGRQVAQRLLSAAGHEVVAVADGQEAVAAVRDGRFDLVLLDQEMPRLDGIGAAGAITAEHGTAAPRLLLLTAHDACDLPPDLGDAGIERVITKPLTRAVVTGLSAGQEARG